jgi:hypothetical protein
MIATIKTGTQHARVVLKGARYALTVWKDGGIVGHIQSVYQDRHADSLIDSEADNPEVTNWRDRLHAWAGSFKKSVRMKSATMIVYYVIGVVLVAMLSQSGCSAGHAVGCKVAKSVAGGN